MRKLIIKGFVFAGLLIIVDIFVGIALQRYYKSTPKTGALQIEEIWRHLNEEKGDILILGASEAHHHYNSKYIANALNKSVSNCGADGAEVCYTDFVLSSVIERHVPEIVILDISDGMLDGSWLDMNSNIRLFYNQNENITSYYDYETDWKEQMKMKSMMYRFNGELIHLTFLNKLKRTDENGFIPLTGTIDDVDIKYGSSFELNAIEFSHLKHMVSVCKNHNIKLLMVVSPKGYVNNAFCEWIKDYAYNNNIQIDFEIKDPFWYNNPDLFKDRAHLNATGAGILSNRICELLKERGFSK